MPELFTCPHCGKSVRVPDNLLGRTVKCPACGGRLVAGEAPPEAEPPPRPARPEESYAENRPSRRPDDDDVDDDRPPRRRDDDDENEEYDDAGELRRRRRGKRRRRAEEAVNVPSILMIVLGGLGLLMGLLNIFVLITGMGADPNMKGDAAYMAGRTIGAVVSVVWAAIVILGGFQMRGLRSRGSVITAAIFAMVPCNPCCILGIPVGAWALFTVNQPDVKDAFR